MDEEVKPKRIKIISLCAFIVLILLLLLTHKGSKPAVPAGPPVIVSLPSKTMRPDYISQTGNTVAYQSVDLVARVEGYLDEQNFVDGAFIKKGQLLFVIQPQPYAEQLKQAKANVSAKKANLAYAKAEYARQQRMYKQNATSLNSVEKWLARTEETQAELDEAEASEVNAGINYGYTHIESPFDGRIGRHLVDLGNLVGNGEATKLANIEQIAPIYVYFNLNELALLKLREAAKAYGLSRDDIQKIPVEVQMQGDKGFPHRGHLNFVNTGLDASTGTMEFRALLDNTDLALVPGLFVTVRVAVTKPIARLTVPDTAVLYDQLGAYVLLVDKNNVAVMQRVTLGSVEDGVRAINKGLKAEDRVITDGLQFATPGLAVTVKQSEGGKQS